jgi:hypothetical protein
VVKFGTRPPLCVNAGKQPVKPSKTAPNPTLRPHFVNISPTFALRKRPKPPFCAHFRVADNAKTQRKQGILDADCGKLRRKVRAGRVAGRGRGKLGLCEISLLTNYT